MYFRNIPSLLRRVSKLSDKPCPRKQQQPGNLLLGQALPTTPTVPHTRPVQQTGTSPKIHPPAPVQTTANPPPTITTPPPTTIDSSNGHQAQSGMFCLWASFFFFSPSCLQADDRGTDGISVNIANPQQPFPQGLAASRADPL